MRSKVAVVSTALLGIFPATLLAQFHSVRVQVIDVGQADGILIRTPNQRWILIDAGQSSVLADSLPTRFGVDSLALVVGTHRHKDHIGGMDQVIKSGLPVALYVGDTTEYTGGKDDDSLRFALQARREDGDTISVSLPTDADTLKIDGVSLIILPRTALDPNNENNNSVVVRLDYGEFSMLFTGDAEVVERAELVAMVPELLDVDVLKASHHGSHNGTSDDWLDAITPRWVVISAGHHAGFKHPHAEAVNAYVTTTGGRVRCTNRHGTVRIYGSPNGSIRVTTQRASQQSCTYIP